MINTLHLFAQAIRFCDPGLNIFLDISVRVLLGEINIKSVNRIKSFAIIKVICLKVFKLRSGGLKDNRYIDATDSSDINSHTSTQVILTKVLRLYWNKDKL